MKLAENIKSHRQKRNMTQKELAAYTADFGEDQ